MKSNAKDVPLKPLLHFDVVVLPEISFFSLKKWNQQTKRNHGNETKYCVQFSCDLLNICWLWKKFRATNRRRFTSKRVTMNSLFSYFNTRTVSLNSIANFHSNEQVWVHIRSKLLCMCEIVTQLETRDFLLYKKKYFRARQLFIVAM